MKTSVQELKECIGKDNLESALLGFKNLLPLPFENEFYTLENRYEEWKKDMRYGIAKNTKKHQILKDLSALLDELTQIGEDDEKGFSFSTLIPITRNDIVGEILRKLHRSITIRSPKRNATIKEPVITAHGKFLLDIPSAYKLWMLQKVNGFYYHAGAPIKLDHINGRWCQENFPCISSEKSELLICLVSENGARLLHKKIGRGDRSGFKALPRGIYNVKSTQIVKE